MQTSFCTQLSLRKLLPFKYNMESWYFEFKQPSFYTQESLHYDAEYQNTKWPTGSQAGTDSQIATKFFFAKNLPKIFRYPIIHQRINTACCQLCYFSKWRCWLQFSFLTSSFNNVIFTNMICLRLQCFDALGWVAGKASGLWVSEQFLNSTSAIHTHTHTHTTVLRLCGICPGKPGWAGTRRNIHPLLSS